MSEVCGVLTMDRSTDYRCANLFRGGCVSIENDPRPGRPRTSTCQTSAKLMADALEADSRATCEEISRATEVPTT